LICHRLGDDVLRLHCDEWEPSRRRVLLVEVITPGGVSYLNWHPYRHPTVDANLAAMFAAVAENNRHGESDYRELGPIIDYIIETPSSSDNHQYENFRSKLAEIVAKHNNGGGS